mmetsp:Transcript_606/g.749  ORF Transcript_606/g.749 Transcript_606/m.749 type:complete len:720 (-) Transcript_606:540-2699(-)
MACCLLRRSPCFCKDLDEHQYHLQQLFSILQENQYYVKLSKCEFGLSQIKFLGRTISDQGISVDDSKIQAIKEWPQPTNVSELRSFLGSAGYYQKFIKGFSSIAMPLFDLTKKQTAWNWSATAEEEFQTIKALLCSTSVLAIFNEKLPVTMYTDASNLGIGAVLMQDHGLGLQPIAYYSRRLQGGERNYSTYDLELLAIVSAFINWRHYLYGVTTTGCTDHASLWFYKTQPHQSSRQARWNDKLAMFDFEIVYRPGATSKADGLSRMCNFITLTNLKLDSSCNMPSPSKLSVLNNLTLTTDVIFISLRVTQKQDPTYTEMAARADASLHNEILYINGKPWVPSMAHEVQCQILRNFHENPTSGHLGFARTVARIRTHFFWPKYYAKVKAFIKECPDCQQNKATTQLPPGLLHPLQVADILWTSVSLDFITDLPKAAAGFNCILVFVDRFSKMTHFIPCTKKITVEETAQLFLSSVFRLHGMPKDLVPDKDPRFTSDWWKTFTKTLHIHLNMSTAYHPQSDGQTERTNRTLEQMLRMYVRPAQDDWDTYLPLIEYAYNSAVHETTHQTPFEIIYGFTPPDPFIAATFHSSLHTQVSTRLQRARDLQTFVRRRLLDAATRQKQQQDPHRRDLHFHVGDQVWLSSRHLFLVDSLSSKFRVRWVGPFLITRIINEVAYQLELPATWRIHNVFHISLLKPYVPPTSFPQRPPLRPPPILIDGEE